MPGKPSDGLQGGWLLSESQEFPILLGTPCLVASPGIDGYSSHGCPEKVSLSPQFHAKPAAAEDRGGHGEEAGFHQQHPKGRLSHQPSGSHSQETAWGESVSQTLGERSDLMSSEEVKGLLHSSLPALDRMLSSWDVSAFLLLSPDVTSEAVNCWRTEGLKSLRSKGLRSHQKVRNIPRQDWPSFL